MSEDFTPPPRRPAPEQLRQQIAADLRVASARTSRRGRVIAPVAAVLVLVAGVGGALGASRLSGQQDLVPVDRPTSSSTASAAPTPTASPTPSPERVQPETLAVRAMSGAQIRRDTASCLEAEVGSGDPPPRRGAIRTRYAFVQPLISNSAEPEEQRVLFLQDEVGQHHCVDGVQNGWQALSSAGFDPTPEVPGGEVPNTGGGLSATCDEPAESSVRSEVLLEVDEQRVAAARVTLVSDGQAVRVVDVPVVGRSVYAAVQLAGKAARLPMSWRVELHDREGRVLPVQAYGPAGTGPAEELDYPLRSCADLEEEAAEDRPQPLSRPASDEAGVATCLEMVEDQGEQSLDPDRATAEVTISTRTEWGAVLSDGAHYLGCSLYPTREISRSVAVSRNPPTGEEAFHWATNPITPGGESLWAAGLLPGATEITYALPDGTTVAATVSSDGYWLVKARTATAFDREENLADWEPVEVTLVRNGETTTYTMPWTADTMCNQVSHGC